MKIKIIKKIRRFDMPLWGIIVFLLLVLSGVVVMYFSSIYNDLHLCIFKNLTGLPCPSCGLTRSLLSLFRGDIIKAISYNPFFFLLALIIFSLFFINTALQVIIKKKIKIEPDKIEIILITVILIVLLLVNWIYLIIDKR